MDTGEAVVDEEDEECDALFTMDDVQDGTADVKEPNTEEVSKSRSSTIVAKRSFCVCPWSSSIVIGKLSFCVCPRFESKPLWTEGRAKVLRSCGGIERASVLYVRWGYVLSRQVGACEASRHVAVRSVNAAVDLSVPDGLCAFSRMVASRCPPRHRSGSLAVDGVLSTGT